MQNETTTTAKRITIATIKSFIRKNRNALLIKVNSTFDGMTDCTRSTGDRDFSPALAADRPFPNNLEIAGAWFVLRGRDYFSTFSDANVTGYEISNSCGSFILAIRKVVQS